MKKHLFQKITFSLFLMGLGVGLLIAAQWKIRPIRATNPIDPYLSLSETVKKLRKEQGELKKEISNLQKANSTASNEIKNVKKENTLRVELLEKYKSEIGLQAASGKGVVVVIDDSSISEVTVNSIAHAADLRDLINFLWGKKAEAIAINNERIVSTTAVDCVVNTILVNQTKLTAPFVVSVLGNQKEMHESLIDDNNLTEIKQRVKDEGLHFEIRKEDVSIPGFNNIFSSKYVKTIN